jgi:hypothetical protein
MHNGMSDGGERRPRDLRANNAESSGSGAHANRIHEGNRGKTYRGSGRHHSVYEAGFVLIFGSGDAGEASWRVERKVEESMSNFVYVAEEGGFRGRGVVGGGDTRRVALSFLRR